MKLKYLNAHNDCQASFFIDVNLQWKELRKIEKFWLAVEGTTYRGRCKSLLCAEITLTFEHRRTGQHPFGGADRALPEWIQWGGGVVAEIFQDPYSVGGGGSSRIFPGSILCGVAEFFPLTTLTDPK